MKKSKWIYTLLAMLLNAHLYCQDTPQFPPPGKLIDAGGHLLHIHSMGKGKPVVIMENGSGDFSITWSLVQPAVARFATAVTYNRAGFA